MTADAQALAPGEAGAGGALRAAILCELFALAPSETAAEVEPAAEPEQPEKARA